MQCEKRRKFDMTWKQDIFLTLQQQQMLIDALTNVSLTCTFHCQRVILHTLLYALKLQFVTK